MPATKDRYRFAGPCDGNEVPYKYPAIRRLWIGDESCPHIVLQFKRTETQRYLYFFSENDEFFSANWIGTQEELDTLISGNFLTFSTIRIEMSTAMTRALRQPPE
jgi:hypothetical protein